MKQVDMEKEKKKCSGTYLEDSHPDIYPESVKEESGYYVATKKKQGEYTIEDYRKLPEDERAELIDGTIYDMAAPLSVHQLLASKIYSSLVGYIEKNQGACIPMFAPVDVQLDQDDKTMVQPDLMIVCDRKKLTRQGVFGAPDFIIEILSESTRKKDSYLKLMKYQKAGVREYWLVDPDKEKDQKLKKNKKVEIRDCFLVKKKKKKVIVYDLEKVEIPVIYGFTDQVPVRIFDGKCVVDFSLIYENIKFIYEQS